MSASASLLDLLDPIGIDHQPACKRNEIYTGFIRFKRFVGRVDRTLADDWRTAPDRFLDQLKTGASNVSFTARPGAVIVRQHVNVIQLLFRQHVGQVQRVSHRKPRRCRFFGGKAVSDDKRSVGVSGDGFLYLVDNRKWKGQPPLAAPAPTVVPAVAVRRVKLLQQKAESAMDLDAVESGDHGAPCGFSELPDQLLDLMRRQLPGEDEPSGFIFYRARADDVAVRNESGVCIASAMMNLQDGLRSLRLNDPGPASQLRYHFVAVGCGLSGSVLSSRGNVGARRNDHAGASGPSGYKIQLLVS